MDFQEVNALVNLGGMGIVASLFIWVLTKRMPAQEEAYRKDISDIVARFTSELQTERESRAEQHDTFRTIIENVSSNTLAAMERILREFEALKNRDPNLRTREDDRTG